MIDEEISNTISTIHSFSLSSPAVKNKAVMLLKIIGLGMIGPTRIYQNTDDSIIFDWQTDKDNMLEYDIGERSLDVMRVINRDTYLQASLVLEKVRE